MFGNNPIRSKSNESKALEVTSIFYTIQGEGPFGGCPALFIRLAGCNLACTFCFVGSTQVTMGDGKRKRIDQVQAGELVLSYDEASGKFVPNKVLRTMTSQPGKLLRLRFSEKHSDNPSDKIICTPEHPFLVRGRGWVAAQDLRSGDAVMHLSNSERMRMFNAYRPTEYTPERRQSLGDRMRRTWKDSDLAWNNQLRMTMTNPMKKPETALKAHLNRKDLGRMTGAETRFAELVDGLPVDYCGDGSLVVGHHVPDFRVTGKNKVIEVWAADAQHAKERDEVWKQRRASLFAEQGYETLFVALPPSGVRDGTYTQVRKQVAEFARNGDIFYASEEIHPGDKAWVALAGSASGAVTTYNLEVEHTHTYLANGKIVHNCDTEFEVGMGNPRPIPDIIQEVLDKTTLNQRELVVITGGEPLRQNIGPLCECLLVTGTREIQLETAGTLWPEEFDKVMQLGCVKLVCSPKTPKVHPRISYWCTDWKYVIKADSIDMSGDGLPIVGTQPGNHGLGQRLYRAPRAEGTTIWVSPCDEYDPVKNAANLRAVRDIALRHGYRVSLQTHKLLEVE